MVAAAAAAALASRADQDHGHTERDGIVTGPLGRSRATSKVDLLGLPLAVLHFSVFVSLHLHLVSPRTTLSTTLVLVVLQYSELVRNLGQATPKSLSSNDRGL